MNKEYKIKLDLNKKLYNKKMAFNQFDKNVNDFYIEVTKNNEVVKDLDKSIITLVAIKPNGEVDAQFIEVKEGQIYADLKPSMCDLVGNYQAKAMIVLDGEIVTTDTINYSVNEDKIISKLNEDVVSDERFTLFTDALARLSDIEASEEQRITNEAERILSEENRRIEEAKRVEAELVRQHEEADRAKYDATRESNENIRKQNESIRLANETNRIDEEAKRVEEENKRKLAEEERNANYNFMTEDEERRRSEANSHKEAEVLRVQAETDRVNEEAKRRTTEQARVLAENTRVSNENTREANETTRQNNETQRVEAETQRQNRYNSFIADAEVNANNFENYTNNAKVNEEERKSNELDRKSQEDRRVSNETERISNENTRKANEVIREENETSRQGIFEDKVDEFNEKIVELNTTKENFVSSINTKVDNKISEIDKSKTDMTTTVSNKIDEVETRFNALTSSQQQSSEVIDARDGETSLKARLDRDIEKAKQVYVDVEGSHISTDSSSGYLKDVEILGNTVQDASNLADIRSVGDIVEGQELYEIPVVSCGKNLVDNSKHYIIDMGHSTQRYVTINNGGHNSSSAIFYLKQGTYSFAIEGFNLSKVVDGGIFIWKKDKLYSNTRRVTISKPFSIEDDEIGVTFYLATETIQEILPLHNKPFMIEEGTVATPYEPYQEDKLTILSPVQLEKVGDIRDRIICKDGIWGVEKNVKTVITNGTENITLYQDKTNTMVFKIPYSDLKIEHSANIISDKFMANKSITGGTDVEGICVYSNGNVYVAIDKTKLTVQNIEGFKTWLKNNSLIIKYPTTQPQFIPLPHDQQVKLRTFANKTNISFLTEIEGTIKAQVPKSLGATVNTHTEQISNLNKELDRVKKLEESTVSTVETESDFTTVEATSNGYFEDVKLEGKTLVNLFDYSTPFNTHWKDITISQGFKPNTTYTFIIQSSGDASSLLLGVLDTSGGAWSCLKEPYYVGSSIFALTTDSKPSNTIRMGTVSPSGVKVTYSEIVILEGDHTQNPPSYFEGLKSVGQSATTSEDGADEIVVSSVKGDGNLLDKNLLLNGEITFKDGVEVFKYIDGNNSLKYNYYFEEKTPYTISLKLLRNLGDESKHTNIEIKYTDGTQERMKLICDELISFTSDANKTIKAIVGSSSYTIATYIDLTVSQITKGTTPKQYTPHKQDKKRLLYYNNETQAWEKPILRQWDSIEKHSDGKYYYHQRSGEVVLNGSEPFVLNTQDDLTIRFSWRNVNIQNNSLVMCDKFNYSTDAQLGVESISVNRLSDLYIVTNKSKLSTQDAQGFKKWLQANNVTVVYQLAQEKVYECTNIDLITYANETNYVVESGAIVPRTTLKVHNNISNVVSLLQKKVSLLESNIKASQEVQDMMILETDMRMLDIELALMEFIPMTLNLGGSDMLRSATYFNFLKNHIINETYEKEYLENVMNKYLATGRINQDEYDELYKMLYPPVYDIELPIEY